MRQRASQTTNLRTTKSPTSCATQTSPEPRDFLDSVKKLYDDIKAAQDKFLDDQKELKRKLKDASSEERDKLRTEIKEKREAFLEQQRNARGISQTRQRSQGPNLKDHKDIIDDAKEQAKDKVKRKGGGD